MVTHRVKIVYRTMTCILLAEIPVFTGSCGSKDSVLRRYMHQVVVVICSRRKWGMQDSRGQC